MNFKEMQKQTFAFLTDLDLDGDQYVDFWRFHGALQNRYDDFITKLTAPGLTVSEFQSIQKNCVNNVRSLIAETDLGKVFVSLSLYRSVVEFYKNNIPLVNNGLLLLEEALTAFWKELNQLMRQQDSFQTISNVVRSGQNINTRLHYFKNCKEFLNQAESVLSGTKKLTDEEESVSIEFSAKIQTVAELKMTVDDIQTIYSEVCFLFSVDEHRYPLTIAKIESGSLWVYIFGQKSVIGFVTWFLTESIKYLHRNFTTEGKIEQIPLRVNCLEKQFGFLQKLKDTLPKEKHQIIEEGSERLAKAATVVAKRTQKLLAKEAEIIINDEVFGIEPAFQGKYLEMAQKQLPQGTDNQAIESA